MSSVATTNGRRLKNFKKRKRRKHFLRKRRKNKWASRRLSSVAVVTLGRTKGGGRGSSPGTFFFCSISLPLLSSTRHPTPPYIYIPTLASRLHPLHLPVLSFTLSSVGGQLFGCVVDSLAPLHFIHFLLPILCVRYLFTAEIKRRCSLLPVLLAPWRHFRLWSHPPTFFEKENTPQNFLLSPPPPHTFRH